MELGRHLTLTVLAAEGISPPRYYYAARLLLDGSALEHTARTAGLTEDQVAWVARRIHVALEVDRQLTLDLR